MNTTSHAVRLFSAIAAVAVTMFLLSTVCSIAEPQRSTLMAKIEHRDQATPVAATTTLAMAAPAKVSR